MGSPGSDQSHVTRLAETGEEDVALDTDPEHRGLLSIGEGKKQEQSSRDGHQRR